MGNNCKIGSGVTLGPYVSLSDDSIIDNSVVENSILVENCKLLGKIYLLNGIIGKNCQILTNLENSLL